MSQTGQRFLLLILIGIACVRTMAAAERWSIGLTAADSAYRCICRRWPPTLCANGSAHRRSAGPGRNGRDRHRRNHRVRALPRSPSVQADCAAVGKSQKRPLQFPPSGTEYRDNAESHVLWRWIGIQAPDLVVIAGDLMPVGRSSCPQTAAGFVGTIPGRAVPATSGILQALPSPIAPSEARLEINRRRGRSPRQLADELGKVYGRDFAQVNTSGNGVDSHSSGSATRQTFCDWRTLI